MVDAIYMDFDCPNCKAVDAIHVLAGYEADGDENGVSYCFEFEVESTKCGCDLYELDLIDEIHDEVANAYRETYQPMY
ncbi:MAG TPA: hypothetical protein VGC91_07920 [Pyrinomonadaceae bacterium]|jgi:hypothetical protein